MSSDLDVSALDDATVEAFWCALLLMVDDIHIDPSEDIWGRLEELKHEFTAEWNKRNGYDD